MKNISFIIIYCWYFNECTVSKQEMKMAIVEAAIGAMACCSYVKRPRALSLMVFYVLGSCSSQIKD